MNLTVRPVTVRADARIAPRRPAGYAYVVAGASRPQQRGGGLPSAGCLALRARNNGAADYHPPVAWRFAPHNQRMKPTSVVKACGFSALAAYPPPRWASLALPSSR